MADATSVSIVIPAYHEAEAIAAVVSTLRGSAPWHEIIVVDDGSADATAANATAAASSTGLPAT